jgi:dTDP-4-dehydrorhamnose reductase
MACILVIGAHGMLGRDLMGVLRSSFQEEVVGWDIEEIDIREQKPTVAKIERLRPSLVINLAAFTQVDACESQEEQAFAVNAEGMKHVALGAAGCGARVLYLSTDYVFDGSKAGPYVETDLPHPLSVYGRSKLQGERYVQDLAEGGVIVRTQWLYGKHGKNFVDAILRQAKEVGSLSIVDDQWGSPTYTVDLSRALAHLIRHNARGTYHVANSGSCTWYTFGRSIMKLSGYDGVTVVPITSEALNRPAPRPRNSVFDGEKLKREMGMSLRPWSEAVQEYLQSLRQ